MTIRGGSRRQSRSCPTPRRHDTSAEDDRPEGLRSHWPGTTSQEIAHAPEAGPRSGIRSPCVDHRRSEDPFLNAACPESFEVHADAGGPVYINGEDGELKVYNDGAYEISHSEAMETILAWLVASTVAERHQADGQRPD